jgi:ABC-type uncharacterized transport system substrate-binding protein
MQGEEPLTAQFSPPSMIIREDPMKARFSLFLIALAMFAGAGPAAAHPHVWVAVRSEVLFSPDGTITGIRHAWTFDEMYSAFAVQGLGKNGKPPTAEELAPLAQTNVESLAEFEYFTFAKQNNAKLAFNAPMAVTLEADAQKIVTLRFTLPLATPVSAQKPFSFQVYDPTYFVSFGLEKQHPVTMAHAPAGCSLSFVEPKPLLAAETQKLSEAFFQNFSPGADYGMKLATRVIVACP